MTRKRLEKERKDKLKIRKLAVKPLRFINQAQTEFNAYASAGATPTSHASAVDATTPANTTLGITAPLGAIQSCALMKMTATSSARSLTTSSASLRRVPPIIAKSGRRFDRLMGPPPKVGKLGRIDYERIRDTYKAKRKH